MLNIILISFAALTAAPAQAFVAKAPVIVGIGSRPTLPTIKIPVVTIKPTMLPSVKLPVVGINQTLKLAEAPVPVPVNIALPGLFNPNSPMAFPSKNEGNGKFEAKLGELFDGSVKKEAPAVPVGEAKGETAVGEQKDELIQARKADNHVTLPENDLLSEIGVL